MDEWMISKEWAAHEILSILRRNDADFAEKLLVRAKNMEKTLHDKKEEELCIDIYRACTARRGCC